MEPYGAANRAYGTRLRSARETHKSNTAVTAANNNNVENHGIRGPMVKKVEMGSVAQPPAQHQKRALGDITNNVIQANASFQRDAGKKTMAASGTQQAKMAPVSSHARIPTASNVPGNRSSLGRSSSAKAMSIEKLRDDASTISGLSHTSTLPAFTSHASSSLAQLSSQISSVSSMDAFAPYGYRPIPDIDAADAHDPLFESEYVKEIYANWRRKEERFMPDPHYMQKCQADVTWKMREILIDWLVDVHQKFRLQTETLYLTTNIIDRFLGIKAVQRQKLQLVGITSMLIASKYQEIYAPDVQDFVYISDNAYSADDVLQMEAGILNALKFNVTVPSAWIFLNRYLKAAGADRRMQYLSNYCLEVGMLSHDLISMKPSLMAASALYLSRHYCGIGTSESPLSGDPVENQLWTPTLEYYTEYTVADLQACVSGIRERVRMDQSGINVKLTALKRKYSQTKYGEVAKDLYSPGRR